MKKSNIIPIALFFLSLLLFSFIWFKNNDKMPSDSKIQLNPTLSFDEKAFLKYFYEPPQNTQVKDHRDWLQYTPIYQYNLDSFNERFNYSINKPQGVYRIITLGDSNTEGKFVDTKNNYPEQLEDLLNSQKCQKIQKFEVINLGVSGYDLQYSLERFKKRGNKYQPDLILWLISGTSYNKILEKIYQKSNDYRKQMTANGELKSYESRGIYYPFENQAIEEFFKIYGKKQHQAYQEAVLNSLRDYYKGPLVLLTIDKVDPAKFPREIAINLDQKYKSVLSDFTKNKPNTYLFDTLPTLEGPNQRLADLHPTTEGYKIFSNSIFDFLKSHKLLPCS